MKMKQWNTNYVELVYFYIHLYVHLYIKIRLDEYIFYRVCPQHRELVYDVIFLKIYFDLVILQI